MSQNIQQIFVANPASSMVSTDLLYLGRSSYGPTDDFAITFANFVASIGTATPTASTIPRWDSQVNMSANNFLAGFASTATAAATTTLTVSSAYNQYFTGSTTQTVVLPVTSTLALGFPIRIINNSTGIVTVQSSGANTIQAMAPGSMLLLTCILISGTTAASWDVQYTSDTGGLATVSISGTSQAAAVNTRYIVANTGQTTVTLPATCAIGDVVAVRGLGAAGWILAANTGQTIQYINATTTSGGSLTSAEQYDNINVECIVANSTWTVAFAATTGLTVS